MFTQTRTVFLKETDATGVIYFASLFQYGLEAFESFLLHENLSLTQIFSKNYLMPIVHAEADFKAPLRAGDEIRIELSIVAIGKKSFSTESFLFLNSTGQDAGRVKIVHAFVKKGDEKASEIPEELLSFLSKHLV